MPEMSDLRDRIANAIARVTASKAADEVLREIAVDHVIVPRDEYERLMECYHDEHEG